jgi:hypothetical protein
MYAGRWVVFVVVLTVDDACVDHVDASMNLDR